MNSMWPISQTRILAFLIYPFPFPPGGEGGRDGDLEW